MNKEPVPLEFYELVSPRWELEQVPSEWSTFIKLLRDRVLELYQNQPERLLQILYRLDVPEEHFIYASQLETLEDTVQFLTQKIIERELKRYYFRKNYKGI
jgi:hypothetical protein